jgi:tetratricopeptide (TPR) repeat protein
MVAVDLNNLASAIASQGRYQEAETMYLDSLSINQRLLGENHPDTSYQFQGLGSLYERWQKPEKAIEAYERALDLRRAALGETHPVTISSVIRLATVLIENGSPGRGEALLREARALVAAGRGDPSTIEALDAALEGRSR